jgi:hypothetical protein
MISKKLIAAAGNAGGGGALYVEDVFSTYLYTGSGAARTIDNNIALSDEGGLVWLKQRGALDSHVLFDTVNGPEASLSSNSLDASSNYSSYLSFPSAGTTGWNLSGAILNGTGTTWASWTFRKAEKFFDVVTYTGDGVAGRTVAHNLGSVPAVMIIKRTSTSGSNWRVYHSSLGNGQALSLNATDAAGATTSLWNSTTPTDSVFTLGDNGNVNLSGGTFVAYLFASDAGGFGDDGSESIIKCGSYTGTGAAGNEVNLGFEPQFLIVKNSSAVENWGLFDSTRAEGFVNPNTSGADTGSDFYFNHSQASGYFKPTATGFRCDGNNGAWNGSGQNHIYIAIRRPMKTPESGTEVFAMDTPTSTTNPTWNSGFVADFAWYKNVNAVYGNYWYSRLTGGSELEANSNDAEIINGNAVWDFMDGFGKWNNGSGIESWMFKRATGFFDVVAYSGTGSTAAYKSNLGVPVEFVIVKRRDNSAADWYCWHTSFGQSLVPNIKLNSNAAKSSATLAVWLANPNLANYFWVTGVGNTSGAKYISYHFATLAGVSKVGSYTGTAATLNVDCGFSAGARFILIKRTDSTGDWYVYDSERGIVAGNDPYFVLNTDAAQVTNTDYIDPLSSGFTVTSSAPAALNASGGTYIFLAIA